MVVLLSLKDAAQYDNSHENDVHEVVGEQELLLKAEGGEAESKSIGAIIIDPLDFIVAGSIPQHLERREGGGCGFHDCLGVEDGLEGLDHLDTDHPLGDARGEHDDDGQHVKHYHDDLEWVVHTVGTIVGQFGIHPRRRDLHIQGRVVEHIRVQSQIQVVGETLY